MRLGGLKTISGQSGGASGRLVWRCLPVVLPVVGQISGHNFKQQSLQIRLKPLTCHWKPFDRPYKPPRSVKEPKTLDSFPYGPRQFRTCTFGQKHSNKLTNKTDTIEASAFGMIWDSFESVGTYFKGQLTSWQIWAKRIEMHNNN